MIDQRGPRRGQQVADGLADRGAEDVARGPERVRVPVRRVAGHEDRPARQPDHLHDGGGDPDRHRDPHRALARELPHADRDRRHQRRRQRQHREPRADRALMRAEVGEHVARRLVEHIGVVEDRSERGEGQIGQDRRGDQQDCGESGVHGPSFVDWWLASAIQATRTLSGWSTRWSRASAATSSRSPRRWAVAMATSWRSRVVAATPSARASSRSPSAANERRRDEDQRIVARGRLRDDRGDRLVVAHHEPAEQVRCVHRATLRIAADTALTPP